MRLEIPCPYTSLVWSAKPSNSKRAWLATAVLVVSVFSIVLASLGLANILQLLGSVQSSVMISISLPSCIASILMWGLKAKRAPLIHVLEKEQQAQLICRQQLSEWIDDLFQDQPLIEESLSYSESVEIEESLSSESLLDDLPDELLILIFSFLDPISLLKIGSTCFKFNGLIHDQNLTRKIDFYRFTTDLLKPYPDVSTREQPLCIPSKLAQYPELYKSKNTYLKTLMCAKVAIYYRSIGLSNQSNALISIFKKLIPKLSLENQYRLRLKFNSLFEKNLEIEKLDDIEKSIDQFYGKTKTDKVVIQCAKCAIFCMIAKFWRKQNEEIKSMAALKKMFKIFRTQTIDPRHLNFFGKACWKPMLKESSHSIYFEGVLKMVKEGRDKYSYTYLSVWIYFAIHRFAKNQNETHEWFKTIEERIFEAKDSDIDPSLKMNLLVELAHAKAKIKDREGCKQLLLKMVDFLEDLPTLSSKLYCRLAKICNLINPNSLAMPSKLIELAGNNRKAQVKILLTRLR